VDVNGNSVRAWVIMDAGGYILETIQEGPEGRPAATRGLVILPDWNVPQAEVRHLLGQEQCVRCGAWEDAGELEDGVDVCRPCFARYTAGQQ
jgi:hypothetical protein